MLDETSTAQKYIFFILLKLLRTPRTEHLQEKSGAECAVGIVRAKRRGRGQRDRQKLHGAVMVDILNDKPLGFVVMSSIADGRLGESGQ